MYVAFVGEEPTPAVDVVRRQRHLRRGETRHNLLRATKDEIATLLQGLGRHARLLVRWSEPEEVRGALRLQARDGRGAPCTQESQAHVPVAPLTRTKRDDAVEGVVAIGPGSIVDLQDPCRAEVVDGSRVRTMKGEDVVTQDDAQVLRRRCFSHLSQDRELE